MSPVVRSDCRSMFAGSIGRIGQGGKSAAWGAAADSCRPLARAHNHRKSSYLAQRPGEASFGVLEVHAGVFERFARLPQPPPPILMRLAYRPIEKGTIVLFILIDTSFAGRFERPRKQE